MNETPTRSDEYEAPAFVAEKIVIFPYHEVVVTVRDSRNKAALQAAMKANSLLVSAPLTGSGVAVGDVGVLAHVQESVPESDGAMRTRLKGLWRVGVEHVIEGKDFSRVKFAKAEEFSDGGERPEVMKTVLAQIDEFVKLIPDIPAEIVRVLRAADSPGKLADLCAYSPQFTFEDQLELLNTRDPEARLVRVSKLFDEHLALLRKAAEAATISECDTCADLADRAIESTAGLRPELISEFLAHVVQEHTGELVALLAEKYGPVFLRRRAMK